MQALDMVANNLANAATTGFKSESEFHDLLVSTNGTELPQAKGQWSDPSQGTLVPTQKATDFALAGPGFFVVESKAGPLLTRNGSFHQLSDGQLATAEGHKVRSVSGDAIKLAPGVPFSVREDGAVIQNGAEAGRMEIVSVADSNRLEKMGNSFFNPRNAGPLKPSATPVVQGSLENSNVGVVESSVRMISIMRQFESLQKALTLNADMNRKTIEEVARVTAG